MQKTATQKNGPCNIVEAVLLFLGAPTWAIYLSLLSIDIQSLTRSTKGLVAALGNHLSDYYKNSVSSLISQLFELWSQVRAEPGASNRG